MRFRHTAAALATTVLVSCSSGTSSSLTTNTPAATALTTTTTSSNLTSFTAEVWADNWFSLYINGKLVGEDSVSITTEKSFNSEQITFTASYPFTIAMVTKDFKQNDSGLEYIGTDRQQMGDGGFVAQFTDTSTGRVVATTSSAWRGLVVHQAPINTTCETSSKPDVDCTSRITAEPSEWTQPSFNDSSWPTANTYSKEQVGVKDGYDDITWSSDAQLIWTSNLEIDNTILWRYVVTS